MKDWGELKKELFASLQGDWSFSFGSKLTGVFCELILNHLKLISILNKA